MSNCNDKRYASIIIILSRSLMSTTIRSFLIDVFLRCSIVCYITKIIYLNYVD